MFLFKQMAAYEMRISDWSSDVCSSDLYSTSENSAMPATAGRVRMPHNNRVSGSSALKMTGIWTNTIGYDPYAGDEQEKQEDERKKQEQAQGQTERAEWRERGCQ